MVLYLHDGFEVVLALPLVPDGFVVAFDIGILLRFSGLDVMKCYAMIFSPLLKRSAHIPMAIVHPDGARGATLFDDPVKRADDALGRQ